MRTRGGSGRGAGESRLLHHSIADRWPRRPAPGRRRQHGYRREATAAAAVRSWSRSTISIRSTPTSRLPNPIFRSLGNISDGPNLKVLTDAEDDNYPPREGSLYFIANTASARNRNRAGPRRHAESGPRALAFAVCPRPLDSRHPQRREAGPEQRGPDRPERPVRFRGEKGFHPRSATGAAGTKTGRCSP